MSITETTQRLDRPRNKSGLVVFHLTVTRAGYFKLDISEETIDSAALHCIAYTFPTGKKDAKGRPIKKLCLGIQRPRKRGPLPVWWSRSHDRAVQAFMSDNGERILQRYKDRYRDNPGLEIMSV